MKTQLDIIDEQTRHGRVFGHPLAKMPHIKIDAFFEEFPWLWKKVSDSEHYKHSYYVSRVDQSILDYRPMCMNRAWIPFREDWDSEYLRFLNKNGEQLTCLTYIDDKTVGDYIEHFPKMFTEEISFILSYMEYTNTVIIYKPPKGICIPAWIETLIAREKALLKNEISAIDDELEHPRPPEGPPNRIIKMGTFRN